MSKPKPRILVAVIVIVLLLAASVWWMFRPERPGTIVMHGNVDIRQVSLAFNASERILDMRASEGDRVTAGQVLAVLDTTTLKLRLARAEAQLAMQEEALRRYEAGNRPQEIAQADANVRAAAAEAKNAHQTLARLRAIGEGTNGRGVSRDELDAATAAAASADAKLDAQRKAQDLSRVGARQEDIDQARAQRDAALAERGIAAQQLVDAELRAPSDAVVRSRLVEPGDMASPQRPVYALSLLHPKWIRAYVSEANLSRIRMGQAARVTTDSAPGHPVDGRVGYIASVAEFTPKNIETDDLRPSLVYEVRINVDDADNRLNLGMPATVELPGTVAAQP